MRTWCRPRAPVPTTPTLRGAGTLFGGLRSLSRSGPAAASARRRLVHPPTGALDEADQVVDLRPRSRGTDLGADALQGLRRVELAPHEEPEGAVEAGDGTLDETLHEHHNRQRDQHKMAPKHHTSPSPHRSVQSLQSEKSNCASSPGAVSIGTLTAGAARNRGPRKPRM